MSISTLWRNPLAAADSSVTPEGGAVVGVRPRLPGPGVAALRVRRPVPGLRRLPPTDNGTCPLASSGQPIDDATGLLHQIDATLSDVVWIYEPRSERFLYVNSAYEREWQRDARELYADSRQWLRAAHPDDRPLLRASFARLARGDGYDVEYRTTLGSGAQRWIAERALPVSVEAGQWPRFAGVSHDITRHKVEQLEQLRSSRAQNEFLAVLSHELRNPLQPIRSAVALLAQQPADNAAPARKAVSIIERQVDHIARLVDDLLDVSRIKFGKLRLHPEAIRIGDVIESAVAAHQMLIDAQRLCLRHTGPPGPVWVQGDTVRLTQVFCNLLHNAAKFSRAEGTIEIAVHPEDGSGNVAISVRDEGAGIAPALLDSVFDLYVQHDQSVAHDHGGLGIGLSVVRSLVELHGGRVAVRSDGPGRGSEFVVTLPGARDPTAAAAITRRIEPTRTSKRRVLLVDDSRDAAESMQALLEAEGHAVLLAFTGQSALEEAQRAQPDVVILDLDLPDIHGCEVARRLRSQAQSATALLFALTGSDGEQDRQAVLAAGFNQYFVKPANPATLLQALSA